MRRPLLTGGPYGGAIREAMRARQRQHDVRLVYNELPRRWELVRYPHGRREVNPMEWDDWWLSLEYSDRDRQLILDAVNRLREEGWIVVVNPEPKPPAY